MSAAEEVRAILWIANLFENPQVRINRMLEGSEISASAVQLLADLKDTDDFLFTADDYFPFYDLNRLATSVDNHLASRMEEEFQTELPATRDAPIRLTFKTRSLLILPLLMVVGLLLSGCTTRPRVTSGGDTHYTSTTTITISALEGAGSLPPAVGQALRLAKSERKETLWPEQD